MSRPGSYLTPSFEGAVAFARDLIRIPSLSGDEQALADRVIAEMSALGYADVRHDPAGNVIGRIPGRAPDQVPAVMLSCHLDMVAVGDEDEWAVPPLAGEVIDGVLHGRGAMDIKGPLALQTHAAAALAGQLDGDLIVAHTAYEERGGMGMRLLLESGEVRPGAVIIGEATGGDLCVGHRGRAEVEVVLRGRAGHASAPERALNALDLLPAALAAVQRLSGQQPGDEVLGSASLVTTDVSVRPETRNVIPDEVIVGLDWRILPGFGVGELVGAVEAALREQFGTTTDAQRWQVRMARELQRTWTGVEHVSDLVTPGFLMAPDHPVVTAAAEAAGRRDGDGPARVRPWTFATDGGWTCGVHGIPTIGFAPGAERHAHTRSEQLDLGEARWVFDRHGAVIAAVQRALLLQQTPETSC